MTEEEKLKDVSQWLVPLRDVVANSKYTKGVPFSIEDAQVRRDGKLYTTLHIELVIDPEELDTDEIGRVTRVADTFLQQIRRLAKSLNEFRDTRVTSIVEDIQKR